MIYRLIFFMTLFFGFIPSQAQVQSGAFNVLLKTMLSESIPTISIEEFEQKDLSEIVLLDAREKVEYNVSHIQNARWVGYDDFNLNRVKGIDKSKEIVIYCSIGVRSEKIGEKLKAAGYSNVKNLYGSIFEWVNEGNAVYDNSGNKTSRVHAYNKKWGIWLNKGDKVY